LFYHDIPGHVSQRIGVREKVAAILKILQKSIEDLQRWRVRKRDVSGRLRENLQRSEGTQTTMLPLGCSQLLQPSTATKNLSTYYLLPYNTFKHCLQISSNSTVTTHKAGKDSLLQTDRI
jgi:hypothetical protein